MKSRFRLILAINIVVLGTAALVLWGCGSNNNGNNRRAQIGPYGYNGPAGYNGPNGYVTCNPNILNPNDPTSPCNPQGHCVDPNMIANQCRVGQQGGVPALNANQPVNPNNLLNQQGVAPNYIVPNVSIDIPLVPEGQPNIIKGNRHFILQGGFVHDSGSDTCHLSSLKGLYNIDDIDKYNHFDVTRPLYAPCAAGNTSCPQGQWEDRLDLFFDANGNLSADMWTYVGKISTNGGSTPYYLDKDTQTLRIPKLIMYGGEQSADYVGKERRMAAILDKAERINIASDIGSTLPKDFLTSGLGPSSVAKTQSVGFSLTGAGSSGPNDSNLGAPSLNTPNYFMETIENFVGHIEVMSIQPQHIKGIAAGYTEDEYVRFKTVFQTDTTMSHKCGGDSEGFLAGVYLK